MLKVFAILLGFVLLGCTSQPAKNSTNENVSHSSQPNLESVEPAGQINILMIGNSHTNSHNLSQQVQEFTQANFVEPVKVEAILVSLLDQALNDNVKSKLQSGKYQYVVFQGQKISTSHKYTYSTKEAETLANLANKNNVKVYWFSEWSRKDIDETKYIEDIYRGIAKNSAGTVVPVGQVWDEVLKNSKKHELWANDGNHSSKLGATLAAATISAWLRNAPLRNWPNEKSYPKDLFEKSIKTVYERNLEE